MACQDPKPLGITYMTLQIMPVGPFNRQLGGKKILLFCWADFGFGTGEEVIGNQ